MNQTGKDLPPYRERLLRSPSRGPRAPARGGLPPYREGSGRSRPALLSTHGGAIPSHRPEPGRSRLPYLGDDEGGVVLGGVARRPALHLAEQAVEHDARAVPAAAGGRVLQPLDAE